VVSIELDLRTLNSVDANTHEPARSAVQITISDRGIGIPEAELALVFDKFTRDQPRDRGAAWRSHLGGE
jgi:signal transduction histidine kinase